MNDDSPLIPDDVTVCVCLWLALPVIVYTYCFAGV